jgi:hypothetical protein
MIAAQFLIKTSRQARGRLPPQQVGDCATLAFFLRMFVRVYKNYHDFQIDILKIRLLAR